MESWKEGSRTYDECAVGHLLDSVRNADSVQRLQFQRPENEEIQSSLQKFGRLGHCEEYIDNRYRPSIEGQRLRHNSGRLAIQL